MLLLVWPVDSDLRKWKPKAGNTPKCINKNNNPNGYYFITGGSLSGNFPDTTDWIHTDRSEIMVT